MGAYTEGSGNSATTHGFTWTPPGGFIVDSTDTVPVPDGGHLVILIDDQSGAIASEPIAQTPAIAADQMSYQLQSVEVGPTGISYGNLHQGNSNDIVANGQPTVNFRPLLCADI